MRISACIIAKNEERCIARGIKSYLHIVDEVILVDTGSTDRTIEKAKQLGSKVKVFHFEWINDFAAAKNYALDQVNPKADWVLFLDADEWFPEGMAVKLKAAAEILQKDAETDGILLRMRNYVDEEDKVQEKANYAISEALRLWKHQKDNRYVGSIHEALRKGTERLTLQRVGEADIYIAHDGYQGTLDKQKKRRNYELLYDATVERPDEIHNYAYLAREALYDKLYSEQVIFSLRYFACPKQPLAVFELMAFRHLTSALVDMGFHFRHALRASSMMNEEHKEHLFTRMHLCYMEMLKGNQLAALTALEELYQAPEFHQDPPQYPAPVDAGMTAIIFEHGARTAHRVGDSDLAMKYARMALRCLPDDRTFFPVLREIMTEEAFAELIASTYANREGEWERLLIRFRTHDMKLAFFTVFEWWHRKHPQQDQYFLTMLMMLGEYRQALLLYIRRLKEIPSREYAQKAMVACVLANDPMCWTALDTVNQPEMRVLAQAYRQGTPYPKLLVESKEENAFIAIAYELCTLLGSHPALDDWLTLHGAFHEMIAYRIGLMYYENRLYTEASLWMERAYTMFLQYAMGQKATLAFSLGYCHFLDGRYERAMSLYENALLFRYDRPQLLQAVQLIRHKAGSNPDIVAKCDKAIEVLECNTTLWNTTYLSEEKDEKTLGLIDFALASDAAPEDKGFFTYHKGVIANRRSEPQQALALFEEALALNPELGKLIASANNPGANYIAHAHDEREIHECPLCGKEGTLKKVHVAIGNADYDPQYAPIRRWRHCEDCNHFFIGHEPKDERAVDGAFSDDNLQKETSDHTLFLLDKRVAYLKKHSKGSSLLDIGVGNGDWLGQAKAGGVEAMGMDSNDQLAEAVFQKHDVPMVVQDFMTTTLDRTFDIITMSHVLERASQPALMIQKALELLEPDGVLWISTPDFTSPYAVFMQDETAMWRAVQHLQYFSAESLSKIVEAAGCSIVASQDSLFVRGSMEYTIKKK